MRDSLSKSSRDKITACVTRARITLGQERKKERAKEKERISLLEDGS